MYPPIIVGHEFYKKPANCPSDSPSMWVVIKGWPQGVPTSYPSVVRGDPIPARINHGRWIVDCPACEAAQVGDPGDPKFFCVHCLSVTNQGEWLPVQYPPSDARVLIEEALLPRPLPYRNWWPNETVADLLQENIDHGV